MWRLWLPHKEHILRMLSRRKWLLLLLSVIFGFFVINIFLIAHYIDLRSRFHESIVFASTFHDSSTQPTAPKATSAGLCRRSEDSLSNSAYDRMTSDECRSKMNEFLCGVDERLGWPVAEVNNTCASTFDASKVQHYEGCYKDEPSNRFLQGFKYELKVKNSPSFCVQTCLRSGFEFAGVEFQYQCFCGNSLAADFGARRLEDGECRTHRCPNTSDAQFCGGFKAVAVYTTGVRGREKRMPAYLLPPSLRARMDVVVDDVQQKLPEELTNNGAWDSTIIRPKILFLLQLNGRNSRQIRRLIKLIYRPNHLYYIHVDARQEYMQREMLEIEETLQKFGANNFYVARDSFRFLTIWGGTSLLKMFLNVVERTLGTPEHDLMNLSWEWSDWDYILNLSETDMPLLSIDELEYNLLSNMGMSFLSSHGYNTASFVQKQGFNFYFMECESRMWRIGNRKNYPRNLRLDGGSDWVIVHSDLALFAIDKKNVLANQLKLLFSTILLPLESFFHTLALNSQFCDRVLYHNLRLTNWRRKQGCRCAWLRKVVDWCGCSPLAIRHFEHKFDVEKCKLRVLFFARKFDSLIDAETISMAERQVLRFHPAVLIHNRESSPSFDSTWLNFFRADIDSISGGTSRKQLKLYDEWSNALRSASPDYFKEYLSSMANCEHTNLNEIFAFKLNSKISTSIQIGLVSNLSCGAQLEMLVERRAKNKIVPNISVFAEERSRRWQFELTHVEYGVNLDLKEEVFRNFPALIDSDERLIILWHWRGRILNSTETLYSNFHSFNTSKLPANHTSPPVNLQIFAASKFEDSNELIHSELVKPYDSTNFAQYFEIDLTTIFAKSHNASPGIWTALIKTQHDVKLAEIQFPVYPNVSGGFSSHLRDAFKRLAANFYKVVDVCVHFSPNGVAHPKTKDGMVAPKMCRDTFWSSRFPDPKSEIHFGFDKSLAILV